MNLISHRYLICVLFSVSTDRGRLFARLLSLLLLRVIIVVCWFCWCRRLLKVLLIPKDLGTTGDTFCVAWHVPGAIYRFAASLAPPLHRSLLHQPFHPSTFYFLPSPWLLLALSPAPCLLFVLVMVAGAASLLLLLLQLKYLRRTLDYSTICNTLRWGPRHTHKCYPEIAGERGIFALISSRTSGRSAFGPHSINWMM